MYEFAVTPAVTQLRRPGVIITEVTPGSLAEEVELAPSDRIVRVNGRPVRDYLDFRFQTAGETELTLQVKKANGETWDMEIHRDEGEDFGLMFEQIVPRQCANECIFCFCKGNPEDARPSLFVRDEDIRLSFLYGNYTTLSSITPDEMNRIIEQRLSPQYVSIHATDLKTRAYLLGVDESRADISDKLKRLLEADIELHAQVVLCPEINDGVILEKTLRDLAAHYPKVVSTAVVPVALTRYNTDERLTRVTPEFCRRTIKQVEKLQKEFRKTLGVTFAFLGDEIYIKAGCRDPFAAALRKLSADRRRRRNDPLVSERRSRKFWIERRDAVAGNVRTHPAAYSCHIIQTRKSLCPLLLAERFLPAKCSHPILSEQIERYNEMARTDLKVEAVKNEYFGGDVAVAGLLSGSDLLSVKDKIVGDFVIIPKAHDQIRRANFHGWNDVRRPQVGLRCSGLRSRSSGIRPVSQLY